MLLAAALIATSCSSDALGSDSDSESESEGSRQFIAQDETGAFIEEGSLFSEDLRVGDCLTGADFISADTVSVIPCTEPHDGRVYDEFGLEAEFGEEFPDRDVLRESATELCLASEFAEIGEIQFITPTSAGWRSGNRKTTCILGARSLPRDDDGRLITSGQGGVGDLTFSKLQVGDCFADRTSQISLFVLAQDCDGPHSREVYHQFNLEDGPYPGDDAVRELAQQGCVDAFGSSDDAAITEADLRWFQPSEGSWDIAIGGKNVTCHLDKTSR